MLAFEEFGFRKPVRLCCLSWLEDAFSRGIVGATRPQSQRHGERRVGEQSHDLTRYLANALKELTTLTLLRKSCHFPRRISSLLSFVLRYLVPSSHRLLVPHQVTSFPLLSGKGLAPFPMRHYPLVALPRITLATPHLYYRHDLPYSCLLQE